MQTFGFKSLVMKEKKKIVTERTVELQEKMLAMSEKASSYLIQNSRVCTHALLL